MHRAGNSAMCWLVVRRICEAWDPFRLKMSIIISCLSSCTLRCWMAAEITQKPFTSWSRFAAYQNRAAGGGLQAGQAASQQSSVATLRVVFQSDAVRLWVLHDQTRVLGLGQAWVQFTSAGIHGVRPRTGGGLLLAGQAAVNTQSRHENVPSAGYCYQELHGVSLTSYGWYIRWLKIHTISKSAQREVGDLWRDHTQSHVT